METFPEALFPELEVQPLRHRPHNFVSSATFLRTERKREKRERMLEMKRAEEERLDARRAAIKRAEEERREMRIQAQKREDEKREAIERRKASLERERGIINEVREKKGMHLVYQYVLSELNVDARARVEACFHASNDSALGKLLRRDGDHAIMVRVLQFSTAAFTELERAPLLRYRALEFARAEASYMQTPEGVRDWLSRFFSALRENDAAGLWTNYGVRIV